MSSVVRGVGEERGRRERESGGVLISVYGRWEMGIHSVRGEKGLREMRLAGWVD